MRAQFLQLVTHVFINVLESVKKCRSDRRGARAILDARAQLLFSRVHQSAVRVVDDHELLSAEQMMRDDRSESTRLNSSHSQISYAVFCLKKQNASLSE